MRLSPVRIARDYNRALPGPVRWLHVAHAAFSSIIFNSLGWTDHPSRRAWAWPLAFLFAAFLVFPFDGPIADAARSLRSNLGGDVRRELEATQQFGQFVSSLFLIWSFWLLAPARRRRVLDILAAVVIALIAVNILSLLFGRTRPDLQDPAAFTGPFGLYPVPKGDSFVMRSSWSAGYPLASMPSRHACFAAVAAVCFTSLFPVLRPLLCSLALIVAAARVILGAHYPADVFAGAAVGYLIASYAMSGFWGVRAIDWAWKRAIDPFAVPALSDVIRAEPPARDTPRAF